MRVDSRQDGAYRHPLTCGQSSSGDESMRTNINPTQALILGSLHDGDMSGAQIIEVSTQMQDWWHSTRSQVYREIPGLEAKGLIKIIRDRDKVPFQYKELYRITAAGKKKYAEWKEIATPPDYLRNPWMLRYVLSHYDNSDTTEVCQRAATYYQHARQELEPNMESQIGSEALIDYYTLMENWFTRQVR